MKVLVINCGSSSIKFELFAMPEEKVLAKGIDPNTVKAADIAARAARCADDQDQYFNYQGMLYRNQIGWAMSPTTPLDTFIEYAEMLGLDTRVYESCLKSDRHAEVVTANLRLGEALGINGTPTIHVGTDMYNRRLRDYAYQTIKEAIETSLALSPPS